ncbi:uncharacterized protein LOC132722019 isoform X2 [Ruditapes philippinarum]|nr:uncharacterized protein LOC132722019 isoform X2 [Ruditapes philippinarum]
MRSRLCNNPAPSIFGQYCQGGSQKYELCNLDSCTVSNRNNLKQEIVEQFDKEKRTVPTEHEHLKPNAEHPDEMDSMQETYTESSKYEEFIDEVRETLKQNERTALSETNAISSSFQALKTKTEKLMKDHKKLISKENDAFKNQITDIVKGLENKTNMSKSELEKVKRKMKSFEAETQLMNKEVTAISNDFNEHKKEIIEQVEEAIGDSIKRLSNMHSDKMVAFTAYGVSGTSKLVFPHIIDNIGNGYDIATGKFTCTIPGIYFFSFQISKMYKTLTDLVECFIYRNQFIVVGAREDPAGTNAGNDDGGYSIGVSAALHLDTKDTVYIGGCTGIGAVYTDLRSSFTGFLVRPNN